MGKIIHNGEDYNVFPLHKDQEFDELTKENEVLTIERNQLAVDKVELTNEKNQLIQDKE